jgi:predicted O-linked N-acetylglucosamine transferase (SPINDLY family)
MKGDLNRFHQLEQAGKLSDSHLANCYNRLGQTLVYYGQRKQAMEWFDKAVDKRPDSFSYQWSKHLTVPTIYRSSEDLEASRSRYMDGLRTITEMYNELPVEEKNRAHNCAQKLTNFEIHYQSENDMEVQKPYGELFHKIMNHSFPQYMQPLARRHPGNSRRIRVGFASWGCFFTHSNYKTHGAWLTELDKDRFEVFGYELSPHVDQATSAVRERIEHSVPFRGSAQRLRDRIVEDQLDVLVYPGIGMEPIVHRLAPLRLAPVQCTSWGHPVTSGLPNIDYFLSSELMEPENGQEHYSETLVRLPNLGISQIPPGLPRQYRAPEVLTNRPKPATVFLCSQNILKMMPHHDYLFPRILQAVPGSEIWFISSKRQDINDTFIERMAAVCRSYGIDFNNQCLMLPRLGKAEFCYVNENADVMLDTGFWSGCNTTFETLVHGTPVITLPGNTLRGRHTMAILKLHGLDELICDNEQQYVALAAKLATDDAFYTSVTNKIAAIQGDLFGDPEVIEALEDFFERALTGDV